MICSKFKPSKIPTPRSLKRGSSTLFFPESILEVQRNWFLVVYRYVCGVRFIGSWVAMSDAGGVLEEFWDPRLAQVTSARSSQLLQVRSSGRIGLEEVAASTKMAVVQ